MIAFAAIAATFSVAAGFRPGAGASGQRWSCRTDFGVTVAVAVIVSLKVPMLTFAVRRRSASASASWPDQPYNPPSVAIAKNAAPMVQ